MADKNMEAKITVEFEEATSRQQLNSGENISTLFGKIKKIFSDLKSVAFSGSYNDLSDTPDVVTKEYVDPIKSQAAINRTTLGMQCKNLLKNNAVTKTVNGVTFTVNSDGSVTVNGTNTSSSTGANLEICGFKNYGTGKFTASLNSTDSNLHMSVFDNSWVGIGSVCDNEITWDNGNKERLVRLVVKPGATVNNVTVYPMIRYADITDSTYEQYQPSVKEQIDSITNTMILPSGANLNNYVVEGNYVCEGVTVGNSIVNKPTGVTMFNLKILKCNTFITQIIYPVTLAYMGKIYIRRGYTEESSWTNWFEFSGTEITS